MPHAPVTVIIKSEDEEWIYWFHPKSGRYGKISQDEYNDLEARCLMLKYPGSQYGMLLARTPRRPVR